MPRIYCDTNVKDGIPCFEGTELDIYTVANICFKSAEGFKEVKRKYPFLSDEDIHFAILMANIIDEDRLKENMKYRKNKVT